MIANRRTFVRVLVGLQMVGSVALAADKYTAFGCAWRRVFVCDACKWLRSILIGARLRPIDLC